MTLFGIHFKIQNSETQNSGSRACKSNARARLKLETPQCGDLFYLQKNKIKKMSDEKLTTLIVFADWNKIKDEISATLLA